jgi:hypothetical protein
MRAESGAANGIFAASADRKAAIFPPMQRENRRFSAD